jgi:PHS family inorganic phosphate transporter-like MFS transporter
MLGVSFWQNSTSQGFIPSNSDTAIKVATSGGTVLGQLFFGYLADVVGRKRMYGLELIIIIFSTLAQALSSSSQAVSIVGLIIFWRVLMVSEYGYRRSRDLQLINIRGLELVAITPCPLSSLQSSQARSGEVP